MIEKKTNRTTTHDFSEQERHFRRNIRQFDDITKVIDEKHTEYYICSAKHTLSNMG